MLTLAEVSDVVSSSRTRSNRGRLAMPGSASAPTWPPAAEPGAEHEAQASEPAASSPSCSHTSDRLLHEHRVRPQRNGAGTCQQRGKQDRPLNHQHAHPTSALAGAEGTKKVRETP